MSLPNPYNCRSVGLHSVACSTSVVILIWTFRGVRYFNSRQLAADTWYAVLIVRAHALAATRPASLHTTVTADWLKQS